MVTTIIVLAITLGGQCNKRDQAENQRDSLKIDNLKLQYEKISYKDSLDTERRSDNQTKKNLNLYRDTVESMKKTEIERWIKLLQVALDEGSIRLEIPDILAGLRQKGISYEDAQKMLYQYSGSDSLKYQELLPSIKREREYFARDYQNDKALRNYLERFYPEKQKKVEALNIDKETANDAYYDWYRKENKTSKKKGKN